MSLFFGLAGRRSRVVMRERLAAVSRNAPRPSTRDRYLSPGFDPVRILLVGNGIALGYGVAHRVDTLDGQIGRRVAERTGRGVIVNNHTDDSNRLEDQADIVVAGMTLQSEDVVVWCPSYSEMLAHPNPGYWRRTMSAFVGHISPDVTVVLVEIPEIVTDAFDAAALNQIIRAINRGIHTSARRHANVAVCVPPVAGIWRHRDYLYDAAYYDRLGADVTALVMEHGFTSRRIRYTANRDVSPAAAYAKL